MNDTPDGHRPSKTCAFLIAALLASGATVAQASGTTTDAEGFDSARARSAQTGVPLLIRFSTPASEAGGVRPVNASRPSSPAEDDVIVFDTRDDLERVRDELALDRTDTAPRFAILLPCGNLFVMSFDGADAEREVRRACRLAKASNAGRLRELRRRFAGLAGAAHRDDERHTAVRTALAVADRNTFCSLLTQARRSETLRRLLTELGERRPAHARNRLAYAAEKTRGTVRKIVRDALAAIPAPRTLASLTDGPAAEALPRTRFVDGVDRTLLGHDERITVLLFFVHHDAHLAAHVERWNRFARRFASRPVDVIAVGATIVPDADLDMTAALGFDFPTAHYLYEEAAPAYGVRQFPHAVVLAGKRVAYSGDAYGDHEARVSSLLRLAQR